MATSRTVRGLCAVQGKTILENRDPRPIAIRNHEPLFGAALILITLAAPAALAGCHLIAHYDPPADGGLLAPDARQDAPRPVDGPLPRPDAPATPPPPNAPSGCEEMYVLGHNSTLLRYR